MVASLARVKKADLPVLHICAWEEVVIYINKWIRKVKKIVEYWKKYRVLGKHPELSKKNKIWFEIN